MKLAFWYTSESFIRESTRGARDSLFCSLAGDPGADAVVTIYDGFGLAYGKRMSVPDGLSFVGVQAPELANPRVADPGTTEARATREALCLARHLQGRSLHLVG